MKFLHLADLHLGKNLNGFSLIEDQEHILREILKIIEEEETDAVLIAGDVYDKSMPSAEAVRLMDFFLTQLVERKQKVLMISGNHDSAQRIAYAGEVLQSAGVYVSPTFGGTPEKIVLEDDFGPVNFYLLPYLRPSVVRAAYGIEDGITGYQEAVAYVCAQMAPDPAERNVILAHQFLTSAQCSESEEMTVGGSENISADLFKDYDYAALGHIHGAQRVMYDHVRYSGTPLKYSFSEAKGIKSVTIVELGKKGECHISQRELHPLRDLREIKGSYEEVTSRDNYIHTNLQDYVHITLTDEEDILNAQAKLRYIYPNLMKLDYENTRTRERREMGEVEAVEQKSEIEWLQEFYEKQNNQTMSDAQDALARRLLEEIRA